MSKRHPHKHRKEAEQIFNEAQVELNDIIKRHIVSHHHVNMVDCITHYFTRLKASILEPANTAITGLLRDSRQELSKFAASPEFTADLNEFEASLRRKIMQAPVAEREALGL